MAPCSSKPPDQSSYPGRKICQRTTKSLYYHKMLYIYIYDFDAQYLKFNQFFIACAFIFFENSLQNFTLGENHGWIQKAHLTLVTLCSLKEKTQWKFSSGSFKAYCNYAEVCKHILEIICEIKKKIWIQKQKKYRKDPRSQILMEEILKEDVTQRANELCSKISQFF